MELIRTFFISIIIPLSLSSLCISGNFVPISVNIENKFEIGPQTETCYEYQLNNTKNKISLIFSKINSTSAEVILYKSKLDITMRDNLYQNYYDRYLISENSFKEIDGNDFEENIYIIIRDAKYSKVYQNIFILYDTQIPITLINGKPLTMKYFLSGKVFKFDYISNNNLTFVFSSKVKFNKHLNITYNNETILENQIDESDKIIYLKAEKNIKNYLYVTIEDIGEGVEDEEFSVIVYEKGINQFFEVKRNEMTTINYINLNKNEDKQIFLFYYIMGSSTKSNTINFKLDPLASKTGYIDIISGTFHSMNELKSEQLENIFHFEENKFPIEYDINSDEYKKIYFQDSDTSYPYRYIFFKVEISKLEKYYSPKNFMITIGDGVGDIDLYDISYYKTRTIEKQIKPYFPTYFKLNLNPKERYIFISPYPKNTIYIKGDLVTNDENQININKNYFVDEDEIFVFSDISEFTVAVFCSGTFKATFYIEKYIENELYILENMRNNDPLEIKFEEVDCELNRKKYLLGIYKKDVYSKMNKTFIKYWTTNDGEMNVYYRNNATLEGQSLFPYSDKYITRKEYVFLINNYIDFFTFTCTKPGTLTLRSLYKTFNETTYKILQNQKITVDIGKEISIIQLSAPIRPPTNYLYCAIFSKYGKKIKISPDTQGLFEETSIKDYEVFKLKVNLYEYEPDQLAIKVSSKTDTQIEVVEIISYNFSEYTILKDNKMTHITDNNFVKFINKKKTEKIQVKIKGLNNIEVFYDLVKFFTDDVTYLPMAYILSQQRKTLTYNNVIIEIENPYYQKDDDDNNIYLAFVFSIRAYKYYEFDAQVLEIITEDSDNDNDNDSDNYNEIESDDNKKENTKEDNNNTGIIALVIIGVIIITALIAVLVMLYIFKKRQEENKYEMDAESFGNNPLNHENQYESINNN